MKIKTGKLFIISGTSQVGKNAIAKKIAEIKKLKVKKIVTTTTRPSRLDDQADSYNFVTRPEFFKMIKAGNFLEWAKVHNDYYGTPKQSVLKNLLRGNNVMLVIDVQGATQVKKIMPKTITVFILAESMNELKRRIDESSHIPTNQKRARWISAKKEIKASKNYDYVVVNRWGGLNKSVNEVKAIILKNS